MDPFFSCSDRVTCLSCSVLLWCFLFPHPEGKNYFQGRCNVRELVVGEEDLLGQALLWVRLEIESRKAHQFFLTYVPFLYEEQG